MIENSKSNSSKALFFVEAPFQLLSAYEAINSLKISDYKIIIRLSNNDINNNQLKELLEELFLTKKDKKIKFIKISNKNRSFFDLLCILKVFILTFFSQVFYKYIFLGNFESRFLKVILLGVFNKKVILLDDGIKGFSIYKKFTNDFNYNMFTMLTTLSPLDNQLISYHDFSKVKEKYFSIKDSTTTDLLFIGTKISELGIISEDNYINTLETILIRYSDKNITYITHREENLKKLKKLEHYSNFKINKLDSPIEIFLLRNNIFPQRVLSFYSASLFSIKRIYPDANVKAIPFDYSCSEYKELIDEVYIKLKNYDIGIEVVYIE